MPIEAVNLPVVESLVVGTKDVAFERNAIDDVLMVGYRAFSGAQLSLFMFRFKFHPLPAVAQPPGEARVQYFPLAQEKIKIV